ncbi:MAG: ATP-dependent helicase, partial [Lentisphaeria bacterium]|nr:ATP-dependent helicase [Lentisphaeria bacterium]
MSTDASQPRELVAILLPDDLLLEWRDCPDPPSDAATAVQQDLFRRFHEEGANWLFRLAFAPEELPLSPAIDYWRRFAAVFAQHLALTPELEDLRHRASVPVPDQVLDRFLDTAPMETGFEHLSVPRLIEMWEALNTAFQQAVRDHTGTVESLLHALRPDLELAGRVFFHLVENAKGAQPFAFLATYSTRVGTDGAARHLPLKHALQEFGDDREKLLDLLATVYRAARESKLLTSLLESGHIFQPLALDTHRALTFLRETPLYEQSGIRCRIPNWWTAKRTSAAVSVSIGNERPSTLGFDALVSCVPGLEIGGQAITL